MSGYVENQFVSSLKVDPILRSYQVAIVIMNCWFMFHQLKDNQTQNEILSAPAN